MREKDGPDGYITLNQCHSSYSLIIFEHVNALAYNIKSPLL